MGARRTYTIFTAAITAMLLAAPAASAHGNEVHPPADGATGGGAQPGALPQVDEPVVGGGGGDPAPGAQPAAPTGLPPVVNGAGVGNAAAPTDAANAASPADTGKASAPASGGDSSSSSSSSSAMIESVSEPVVALPQTAKGGGGVAAVADAGANAVPAGAVATGAGDLPFTGIEETILLIAVAGMFVPIGVLLYSFARYGEVRWLRRHLSEPRFVWAPSPGMRPDPNRWPDARLR